MAPVGWASGPTSEAHLEKKVGIGLFGFVGPEGQPTGVIISFLPSE